MGNERGEFGKAKDGIIFSAGSYFNKHQINFNHKQNAFSSHRTVFEETFHAGQYLFDKERGLERSDFILEVEVRVARAFVAGDDQSGFKNEKFVQNFSQNVAVQNYFSNVKAGAQKAFLFVYCKSYFPFFDVFSPQLRHSQILI